MMLETANRILKNSTFRLKLEKLEELEKAVCIAGEQYGDAVDAFYKIEGILYNRKKRRNFIIKEKQRDE